MKNPSINSKIQVYCKNTGSYIDAEGGESLLSIANRVVPDSRPICARVNNKTESLLYRVFMPKQVEFLTAAHPSGERTYTRSLCMVLFLAVTRTLPVRACASSIPSHAVCTAPSAMCKNQRRHRGYYQGRNATHHRCRPAHPPQRVPHDRCG